MFNYGIDGDKLLGDIKEYKSLKPILEKLSDEELKTLQNELISSCISQTDSNHRKRALKDVSIVEVIRIEYHEPQDDENKQPNVIEFWTKTGHWISTHDYSSKMTCASDNDDNHLLKHHFN